MLSLRSCLVVLAVVGLGCTSIPAHMPSSAAREPPSVSSKIRAVPVPDPFPDEDTLAAIAARPAPGEAELLGEVVAPVDTWDLEGRGSLSTEWALYEGADLDARALGSALATDTTGRRVTRGMQCVAQEHGRFVLEYGDDPAADLAGFIAARCGTTVARVGVTVRRMPTEELPPALDVRRDGQAIAHMIEAMEPGASVGLWRGTRGAESVIAFATGAPDVEIEPVSLFAATRGQVEIRGRVAWPYDNLRGFATHDEVGYYTCTPIRGEHPVAPAFALRCPVRVHDDMAVIELHATPPGRLLGRRVLRLIVAPGGAVPDAYHAPTLRLPIASGAHDVVAVAAAINAMRRRAGLTAVSVAAGQSTVLDDLLPHFFAATDDPSAKDLADQIALGMIAGRRVEASVRWGAFFSNHTPSSWTLGRELAAELLSPQARAQIFDPDATAVAYASLSDPSHGMRRGVIATYSTFGGDDPAQVQRVFDALDRQRGARGLQPIVRIDGRRDLEVMRQASARVGEGQLEPEDALDDLLRHFVGETRRDMRGTILYPSSLAGWEPKLDGSLVTAHEVAAAVVVGHVQPPGAAWARPLVMIVYTEL